jgi:hypothetical protein
MSASATKAVKLPRHQARAAFVANSFNAEKRTVDVVWSTGARGPRYDWDIGRYYEELSMDAEHVSLDRLNGGASVLNSHQSRDLSAVIGAVVPGSAVVDGKEGRATVLFSEREDVAGFVKDVEAGVIRHISVGYNVKRYELVDKVQEGDDLIPVYRAVDWEPAEISFVPIPFDAGAQARSGEASEFSNCVFVQRGAAAHEGEDMKPEEIEAQRKADAEAAEKRAKEAADAATLAATQVERQRGIDIRKAADVLPEAERAAFVQEHIDGGSSAEAVRAKVIDKLAASQTTVRGVIQTVDDAFDKFKRGATDWLIQRSGLAHALGDAGKNLQPGEYRGMTLLDLARECLARQGVNVRGMDKMALAGMAFTHRGGGMNTTSDFAVLLENTMHKMLLAAYAVQPDTWSRFCAIGSVSDFRAHNRYRMGTFGALDSLTESGEFKNKQIPDGQKETITAATKGNIVAVSRQTIVNDDMNALAQLLTMLGRAAKLSVEVDVYAALALNSGLGPTLNDGKTLFHADHANIGTGSALSVAGLDADRVVMASQRDISSNEYLDLRPKALLVPIGLGGNAKVINNAQYDPDDSGKYAKPNKVNGLFADIVDTPRISGTRRYLFADANVAPVLEVAFLDGQREPVLETQDGWRQDGTEMKVRLDYAVGGVGYHGAVTNAGV